MDFTDQRKFIANFIIWSSLCSLRLSFSGHSTKLEAWSLVRIMYNTTSTKNNIYGQQVGTVMITFVTYFLNFIPYKY